MLAGFDAEPSGKHARSGPGIVPHVELVEHEAGCAVPGQILPPCCLLASSGLASPARSMTGNANGRTIRERGSWNGRTPPLGGGVVSGQQTKLLGRDRKSTRLNSSH